MKNASSGKEIIELHLLHISELYISWKLSLVLKREKEAEHIQFLKIYLK